MITLTSLLCMWLLIMLYKMIDNHYYLITVSQNQFTLLINQISLLNAQVFKINFYALS